MWWSVTTHHTWLLLLILCLAWSGAPLGTSSFCLVLDLALHLLVLVAWSCPCYPPVLPPPYVTILVRWSRLWLVWSGLGLVWLLCLMCMDQEMVLGLLPMAVLSIFVCVACCCCADSTHHAVWCVCCLCACCTLWICSGNKSYLLSNYFYMSGETCPFLLFGVIWLMA